MTGDEGTTLGVSDSAIATIEAELAKRSSSAGERLSITFLMAVLGSIPWVGIFLSAAASIPGEERASQADDLRTHWLKEHQAKLEALQRTLTEISTRFESIGPSIDARLQDPSYLALVRQSFRTWDRAETDEKRQYVANLITNAAGTPLSSDDLVRLFIDWLDTYHEAHFMVIREIYQQQGITRREIWTQIHGDLPREDSAEADLFKLLIHDLSIGHVIRQARDVNELGQFLRRRGMHRGRNAGSGTMESAFEDTKPYVLTELGRQFVHYSMNEVVRRIGGDEGSEPTEA